MIDGETKSASPAKYVRENEEQLERLIKHSNNDFVRALALAALLEYGEDTTEKSLAKDIDRIGNLEVFD